MSAAEPLRAADVATLVAAARRAHAQLAERPMDRILAALDRTSELWRRDRARVERTARGIAQATGYAPASVELCLERTLRAWSGDGLRGALAPARAALGQVSGRPRAWAPDLVVVLLAQNTPALAVAPVYSALALGAAVIVKPARGEPSFAVELARALAEVDPDLGLACSVRTWRGGDEQVEARLFAEADRIVTYGSAATIASVRARAGDRVVARGPRLSVAVVATDGGDVARRLARDVAFLDQRGCLSPQLALVDHRVDLSSFGRALAAEMASVESTWPRRKLSLTDATAFRRAVDEAESKALAGHLELHGGGGAPWAVAIHRAGDPPLASSDRFISLQPYGGLAELSERLRSFRAVLECVGLAAESAERAELARVCQASGASRVCDVGDMQDPPADWHSGGQPPAMELLRWAGEDRVEREGTRRQARFEAHVAQTSDTPRAIDVASAAGSYVYDRSGRAWLDLLAGIGVASIGHAHPDVARAVAAQAARYTHVMVYGEDVLEPQVELAERLASLLPGSLSMAYFTSSGAEAIEGAIKLARKATGRTRILSLDGAFHGDTTGALSLGGNPIYRDPFQPLLPGVDALPWNDESALERIDQSVAAVFAEPVQAEAGVRVPNPEYLPRLAARCRAVGALLVLDEVVTGLGRTGRWFGFEHWPGSAPDVLVLAKALGGGLPLGAFIASPDLLRTLAHDPPLGHVTTFGGNPVACAAALASLDVLARQQLPARAADVGERLRQAMEGWIGHGGLVAVRGLGLLLGLELESADACAAFQAACRERSLLVGWTLHRDRVIRLAPPLTISDAEIDLAQSGLFEALCAPRRHS